jgi:shikimate kinase
MRIVLVGCRGAGKTVVGKIVAHRLHLKFLDTDKIVEDAVGKSISEIFDTDGERFFRTVESEVIRRTRDRAGIVIAAGGGAPMRKSNIANLKRAGTLVFYLSAPAETLHQRCRADFRTLNQRPPLTSARRTAGIAEMRKILKEREPVYRATADATIDTSSSTPSQVASEVIRLVRKFTQKCERGFCGKRKEGEGRQRRARGAHL